MKKSDGGKPVHPEGERIHDSGIDTVLNLEKLAEMKLELGPGFAKVMHYFQAGLLARPEKINQAVLSNNPEQVQVESHSLKSVCRQIGLFHMGELAAKLESIAHTGKLDGAESLAEQLIQIGRLAHHELAQYCISNH